MKNLKFIFNLLCFFMLFIVYSCTSEGDITEKNNQTQQEINLRNATLNFGLTLPDATQFIFEGESIKFILPTGYTLIGYDSNGERRTSGTGDLTCTCETEGSTGKCTPTETKHTVGCNTEKSNPCPECKGKVSSIALDEKFELVEFYIMTPSDNSTIYSLFSDTRAAIDLEEWNNLSWLDIAEVDQSEIEDMVQYAWEGHEESDPTVDLLMISSSGKFIMEIPFASLEAGNIYTSTSKTSCSGCMDKCKLKKAALGKVRYCDGCSSGCTISW